MVESVTLHFFLPAENVPSVRFYFFSLWEEESLEVVKCVGSEWKDTDLRQSFAGMPGPACANAGNGCGGRSRP